MEKKTKEEKRMKKEKAVMREETEKEDSEKCFVTTSKPRFTDSTERLS